MHWPSLPRPGVLLNEPSLHGSGALLPSSQYEPATHSKHAVWPLTFVKLPAAQLAHESELELGAAVPAGHRDGAIEPERHMLPAGHAWHPDCAVRPDSLP